MSLPDTSATKSGRSAGKKRAALQESAKAMPLPDTQDVKKEANPFADRDWRMFIYAWSGLFVRIVLILGAVFSVYQFLAARDEKRVERSLELVELWEQPDYQTAQRALKTRIGELNERYAALIGDQPSESERAAYAERIGIEALGAEDGIPPPADFQEQFDRIVYFLNRVAFCVEGNLCSREVADAYFKDFAVSFWNYFAGYVAIQRKSFSPNYAVPIEQYVLGRSKPPSP
jgi:hypothetical protein